MQILRIRGRSAQILRAQGESGPVFSLRYEWREDCRPDARRFSHQAAIDSAEPAEKAREPLLHDVASDRRVLSGVSALR
jgi:hypothetical protein